jgi:GT2 family glycosyltransferase
MMLERELFFDLDGFDSQYLIGDFEDSDLCLRVYQQGKKNYLLNDIELCHIERQSQNIDTVDQWKQNLTLYNGWLYTRRWQAELELLL